MLRPPNPVAGTTAERSPFVADAPADVILVGPAVGNLAGDRRGLEYPPVGGSLADWVAATGIYVPDWPWSLAVL